MIAEGMKLKGTLTIRHILDDKVIDERILDNLIVTVGKAEAAGLLNGVTSGAFTYLAIGIGVVAPAAGDTALGSEITTGGGARAAATCSRVTTTTTNDTAQLLKEWTFSSTFAVTEAGIFDAAAAGEMLARQTFSAINVVSGSKLEITWKVQVT